MSSKWTDMIPIALAVCGLAIGFIPLIGSPLRLVFGIFAIGSAAGLLVSKQVGKKTFVIIGIIAGIAIMVWSFISLGIVAAVLGSAASTL